MLPPTKPRGRDTEDAPAHLAVGFPLPGACTGGQRASGAHGPGDQPGQLRFGRAVSRRMATSGHTGDGAGRVPKTPMSALPPSVQTVRYATPIPGNGNAIDGGNGPQQVHAVRIRR